MTPFKKLAAVTTLAGIFGLAGCPTTQGPTPSDSGRYPVGSANNVASDICHNTVAGARRDAGQELHYQQRQTRRDLHHGAAGANTVTRVFTGALGELVGGAVQGAINVFTGAGHEVCDPAPADTYYYNGRPVDPGYRAPQQIR